MTNPPIHKVPDMEIRIVGHSYLVTQSDPELASLALEGHKK